MYTVSVTDASGVVGRNIQNIALSCRCSSYRLYCHWYQRLHTLYKHIPSLSRAASNSCRPDTGSLPLQYSTDRPTFLASGNSSFSIAACSFNAEPDRKYRKYFCRQFRDQSSIPTRYTILGYGSTKNRNSLVVACCCTAVKATLHLQGSDPHPSDTKPLHDGSCR